MTPDDLRVQVLALAALLPSSAAPTGVVLTKYRGEGERTYRKGYRMALVMVTHPRHGEETWTYADAGHRTTDATAFGRTDDDALTMLRNDLKREVGRHEYRHTEQATTARKRAGEPREEAADLDTAADTAQQRAADLAAKIAEILGGAQ